MGMKSLLPPLRIGRGSPERPVAEHPGQDPLPATREGGSTSVTRGGPKAARIFRKLRAVVSPATVTISVDEDSVRLVVFEGRKVVGWATLAATTDGAVGETLAERIAAHLRRMGVHRARFVADLPLTAAIVHEMQLTRVPRGLIGQVVRTEMADALPFSPDETQMYWQARKEGDVQHVLTTAVLTAAVQERLNALASDGTRPRALYLRSIALAHATGLADGVIIQAELARVDLIFMHRRLPLFVHHADLADTLTDETRARRIVEAVSLMQGYVLDSRVAQLAGSMPLLMTGSLATYEGLRDEIVRTLGQEVVVHAPTVAAPAHFPALDYVVNIGLAKADRAIGQPGGKISAGVVPTLNMLPQKYVGEQAAARPYAFLGVMVLLGIAGAAATSYIDGLALDAAVLERRIGVLDGEARITRLKEAQTKNAVQKLEKTETALDALDKHVAVLVSRNADLVARLNVITEEAVPEGLALSAVTQRADGFLLVGTAPDYATVLGYADNIRASGRFEKVRVSQAMLNDDGAAFQIELVAQAKQ